MLPPSFSTRLDLAVQLRPVRDPLASVAHVLPHGVLGRLWIVCLDGPQDGAVQTTAYAAVTRIGGCLEHPGQNELLQDLNDVDQERVTGDLSQIQVEREVV